MRHVMFALPFAATFALCGTAYAQEQMQPNSPDGKSVPMQEAPSKIDTGKSKAKRHKTTHRMKKM